jgi:phosphoribosylanthranilate isomerase
VVGSPDSPRNVPPVQAQRLVDQARSLGLRTALVTRSVDLATVREWCRLARPDYVQLHAAAPPEWVHRLAAIPVQVLFAVRPGQAPEAHGAGVVLDGDAGGGSGQAHDWATARAHAGTGVSLIAGGLHHGNARAAVQQAGTWGADASSGLESSPGMKDPDRVRAFVAAVHSA